MLRASLVASQLCLVSSSLLPASVSCFSHSLTQQSCLSMAADPSSSSSVSDVVDLPGLEKHQKSRRSPYPNSGEPGVSRAEVKDAQVPWSVAFEDYKPTLFDPLSEKEMSGPDASMADVSSSKVSYQWNSVDSGIDRTSFHGKYQIQESTKLPLNPVGRTGVIGRGHLWRWGPNHAADPVVTRWQRDDSGEIRKEENSRKPILEFVAILRTDGGGWAIPGGMVEPGDTVGRTLRKEFGEEAMGSLEMESEEEKKKVTEQIQATLSTDTAVCVYRGYVDDPRNTDNAWIETAVFNFHDETSESVGRLKLKAGDDAAKVEWKAVDSDLELYASHSDLMRMVAELRDAHW